MNSSCRQPAQKRRSSSPLCPATIFWLLLCCGLNLLLAAPGRAAERDLLHYEILVSLEPDQRRLQAQTAITVPADYPRRFTLALHPGLEPRAGSPEIELVAATDGPGPAESRGLELFTVTLPPEVNTFVILYGGEIHHPLGFAGQDYARGVQHTPGRIDPEGIYLGPAAFWYPRPLQRPHFLSFRLRTQLPEGWTAVSQGRRHAPRPEAQGNEVVWEEINPQEGIFLVADRYTVYEDRADDIATMAFLRRPDEELARRYLDATATYLAWYDEMIGPYPYAKFALVENAWESGFGMPSFTLLGSRVIRLPFILHSSYPHEILHNWWGNGVYTDYASGNWSEGLTAYLADHLLMVDQGRGAEYRRGVLQKYADYAAGGRDFPLREFTARHSPAGEAVGYGKGLMFFHMLNQRLGEEAFLVSLNVFYRDHLFRVASFDDLRQSFEQTTLLDLEDFFRHWLERDGAPELTMDEVAVVPENDGWLLKATFRQEQAAPPYPVQLPLEIWLAGEQEPRLFRVPMRGRQLRWQAAFDQKPQRLALDPHFDLFRLLDRREIPPAFSRLFGLEGNLLVILPGREEKLLDGYRELAAALGRFGTAGVEIISDQELTELPADRAVILLGWENRFRAQLENVLPALDAAFLAEGSVLQIADQVLSRAGHAFALALASPVQPDLPLGWIAVDTPAMLPGLIRRLPHYHRYGALVFQGKKTENILSHQWPTPHSPLHVDLGGAN
ncbi:M1 family metallopeptidase [Desulfurivibrio sp. C05AmB]|uniref:M1 family metallopeptidase n=1 Tax=Desulfurivibrio sp. C05AmB TaxID=3374371 RepID=UPI00376EF288